VALTCRLLGLSYKDAQRATGHTYTWVNRHITEGRRALREASWVDLYRELGLTIVPPRSADAGKSFSDAEFECEYGRLPGDKTPAFGCWVEERDRPAGGSAIEPRWRHGLRSTRIPALR
jgi:hypothetical protein